MITIVKKFAPLSNGPIKETEDQISDYWKEIDLLHLSVNTRDKDFKYVFYEGPPTANGKPGIHHVVSRTLKDMTCRYKTMRGYQVNRKAGWDTHGLPVEITVEKKLGLTNKKEIEAYGIGKFNEECRNSVFEYEKEWREMTERMAYLIDLDNPYITLDNNYIESVWWILNKMFKDDLIYEDHKILPYCPRCGTGLATHEVAQGYKEIKTETVYVKFKRKGYDEYFLVWTTTPWTLPSNVLLTVNPEVDYIKIKYEDSVYYIAKDLAPTVIQGEYEVLEELKGKDMEHWEYEQLIPSIEVTGNALFVTTADYVTTTDGTGIVHTAPAFGEDDYNTGKRYGAPVINPVNDEGAFTEGLWKGTFVMDADSEIISYLYEHDKMFRKQKIDHNYPHCWRCDTPLIYYAKPSWYIEVTKYKDKLIENNNGVDWYPDFVGEKRFGNWLDNLNDWAISRSRYWGTPLPIWKCECGHLDSVGSRAELVEKSIEPIDETIELHRPYVDDIHFKCEKCGGTMTRESDVIDVWFDSGSMPFAQYHYPFENYDNFDDLFPADFINEGIDQTRGWFYSLIAISTYVTGKSPYKNVLVNDLILDKEGKKMSKSRGNTVDPFELFDQFGADVIRWYLLYVSPPWTPTKFDVDGVREIESKFFRTIKNVYNFFSLYANTDGLDPNRFHVDYEDRQEIDKWILSKYYSLVKTVTEDMDIFEYTRVVRNIQNFVIEDLSNWYIRRSRRRFWKTELDDDKKMVFNTTYEILVGITKLIAPIAPYIAEDLFRKLTGGLTVHIEFYPDVEEDKIDKKLEEKMDLVRTLVGLGRASRENAQIKVRQPLQEVVIDGKYKEIIGDLTELLKEELNVKDVKFEHDLSSFMDYSLKPNFKEAGKILGPKIKEFQKYLLEVDSKEFIEELDNAGFKMVELGGEEVKVLRDYVLINISAKDGFDVMMEDNVFIILETSLSEELIEEGYVREFISKVQQIRKQNEYDVLDNIEIRYTTEDVVHNALVKYLDFIKDETLAVNLERVTEELETFDLNGIDTGIVLEQK